MPNNSRFPSDNRLFQFYRQELQDEYEDDLDTVETQLRSSEENTRRMPQRQQSGHLKRGGFSNSTRQVQPTQLTQMHRHQSHYFSNVDLFKEDDETFNYLKYSRASETRTTPSS